MIILMNIFSRAWIQYFRSKKISDEQLLLQRIHRIDPK